MQDTIIKADGTSRLIKAPAAMPETYAAWREQVLSGKSTLDIALNGNGCDVIGTPLNKATLLKDTTAALYGLDETAVPDDVLSWLGKYNLYWWRRRTAVPGWELVEAVSTADVTLSRVSATSDTYDIQIADSVATDPDTGALSLVDPTTYAVAYTTTASEKKAIAAALAGKYITGLYDDAAAIYHVSGAITTVSSSSLSSAPKYKMYLDAEDVYIPSTVAVTKYGSTWEYVRSADRNAYPDGGVADGYEYLFCRVPFDNMLSPLQVAYGSYIGTGAAGPDSAPNVLTFPFKPLVVFPCAQEQDPDGHEVWTYPVTETYSQYTSSAKLAITWGDNSINWYHNNADKPSAQYQHNMAGTTYYYVAFGI